MNDSKKYDVFISFSHVQQKLAQRFYDELKAANISAFCYSKEEYYSENYEHVIKNALHNSKDFLLICTIDSAASEEVREECNIFRELAEKYSGTENERRVFIYEAPNFKPRYVPKYWAKIHRCNNFNKQIKALGVTKEPKPHLRWLIIGLSVLVVVVGGIVAYKAFVQKPVLQPTESTDTVASQVKVEIETTPVSVEQSKSSTEDKEAQRIRLLRSNFNESLKNKKFEAAEKILDELIKEQDYVYLQNDYNDKRKRYIDENFDRNNEIKFGNYTITKKSGSWGIRDKNGNVKIEFIYSLTPDTVGGIVTFLDKENNPIRYNKNLKPQ